MKRFLVYWDAPKLRNPTSPTTEQIKVILVFFLKKKEPGKKDPRFSIESYLTGIVTTLDSSVSSGQVPRILEWVCVSLRRGGGFSHRVHQVQNKSTAAAGGRYPTKYPVVADIFKDFFLIIDSKPGPVKVSGDEKTC